MKIAPQMYSKIEPLYAFKKDLNRKYPMCQFFLHDNINGELKASCGQLYRKQVREKFLTDGHFALKRYNREPAFIVWKEAVLTLDTYTSFDFNLEDASFYIYDLQYGQERRFEIHVSEESEFIYEKLVQYLMEREKMEAQLDGIRFSDMRTLELILQRSHQKIMLDFKSGKEKVYQL